MKKRLVIEWDDNQISHHFESCDEIRCADIMGIIEMVKLRLYVDNLRKNEQDETI